MSPKRVMDEEDVVHVYNGILFSHKKNEMLFAVAWVDLEIVSQIKKNIVCYHLHVAFFFLRLQIVPGDKEDEG